MLICFFFFGMTSLIYEVVWVRMLKLVFGNTAFAVSTVLAAFMAGLAGGSFYFGRFVDSYRRSPLRLYGFLAGGIGVYCLLVPLFLILEKSAYIYFYQVLQSSFYLLVFARFFSCFILLFIPCFLMGGALPVLSKFYLREIQDLGTGISKLYGINTLGGVFGAGLAGFCLLPFIGSRATMYIATLINFSIAALAFYFDKSCARPSAQVHQTSADNSRENNSTIGVLILAGFGLSGFAALIYEVAWTRALCLILGNSVYAFSAMLLTFLFGLAIGSIIFGALFGRRKITLSAFGLIELSAGFSAVLLLPVFGKLPVIFLHLYQGFSNSWVNLQIIQFLFCFSVMLIPTMFLGAAFPLAGKLYTKELASLGKSIGSLYSINTLGAIMGSLGAGFVFIPLAGVQNSILIAAGINVIAGAVFLIYDGAARRSGMLKFAGFLVLPLFIFISFSMPDWNRQVMNAGVYKYAPLLISQSKDDFRKEFEKSKILYYREGTSALVCVQEREKVRSLTIDGKVDASNGSDMYTQRLLGHLPLLLHKKAEDVLLIGLGSGVTLGAVTRHPVENVDCIEIEPAVVEASEFFIKENHNALRDPRVNLVIADGRNWLAANKKKYDVIISGPSNPWIAGMSSLFTSEFFLLCKKRLAEGGAVCIWAQTYELNPADLKMIIKTFKKVFPHITLWSTPSANVLLVGTSEPVREDYSYLRREILHNPVIKPDLNELFLQGEKQGALYFCLNEKEVMEYVKDAKINTDNLPHLEFSAPKSLYRFATAGTNCLEMLKAKENVRLLPYHLGADDLKRGLTDEAITEFKKAEKAAKGGEKADVFCGFGIAYGKKGDYGKALSFLKKALRINPDHLQAHYNLGVVYYHQENYQEAVREMEIVLKISPGDDKARRILEAIQAKNEEE